MPPYWRRPYRRRRQRWRRRRPFRPAFYRRRWHRRWRPYFGVRKKKKTIKIKQYQPKYIRTCKIKGLKCLFNGSAQRKSNNYWQYPRTVVPERFPGGGGWGLQVMSLSSLYEDFQYLENYWTVSNAGFPLARLIGTKLVFYQHEYVDYVVEVENCWPLVDTPLKHANSQPQRMLLGKKKIIMPSIQTRPLKRRKKKIFVPPPSQMYNHWYFQKDICNTKFLMITATACDLDNYYISPTWQSTCITLFTLNTNLFKNADFQHPSTTTGYQPKNSFYLYGSANGLGTPTKKDQLVYLGDSKTYTQGKAGNFDKANWGNPFYEHYHGTIPTYTSSEAPTSNVWSQTNISQYLTPTHYPPLVKIRYCPSKDNGSANRAYFKDNYRTTGDTSWDPPQDKNLIIEGFPLWIMLWGWPDWQKKLGLINRIDKDYVLVIQTDQFSEKFPYYVLLDDSFEAGEGAYNTPQTTEDLLNWYPKFWYQQKSVELICSCGPGVSRVGPDKSIQAKMSYTSIWKWGGCPSTLEKVYDPCSQPRWATPDNLTPGLKIQNPETDPTTFIYDWDVRRDFITPKATKRLKKHQTDDNLLHQSTGTASNVPAVLLQTHQENSQTSSSEEEEETLQEKLLRLRRRQLQLHKQLLKLAQPIK